MAQTIDIAEVQAFNSELTSLFSEDPAGITNTVRKRSVTAKFDHWERLGGVELIQATSRHQQTPHTPMTHSRRRVVMADWTGVEYLDKFDTVKLMIDPKNEYTSHLQQGAHRRYARSIFAAAIGSATAVDGVDATSSIALPASQQIANGASGLTFAKLRQANRILDNAGVPSDGKRHIAVSAYGIEDLMAETIFTSADYNTLNTINTGGRIDGQFMGYQWHKISDAVPDDSAVVGATIGVPASPVLPKSGNIRSAIIWHETALGLSICMDISVAASIRHDLMDSWQVLLMLSFGVTRVLDAGVVQLDYDESA